MASLRCQRLQNCNAPDRRVSAAGRRLRRSERSLEVKMIIGPRSRSLRVAIAAVCIGFFAGTPGPAIAAEAPIAAEKNPPGDIPDSQVFIDYKSPAGFSIKVPEGWSRTDKPDGAVFADKYDSIEVTIASA